MNKDIFKGQFNQLKGQIRQQWGKLTDDEIAKVQGRAEELAGLIQKKYGLSKEKAEKDIEKFVTEKTRHATGGGRGEQGHQGQGKRREEEE